MPGLIESNTPPMAQAAAPAATPAMPSYDPERITIDPTTDTVEGRVDALIAKNSPLMQRAETRANQQMNSRGLLNSSMAVGAGQSALYDAALPIASQDAQASLNVKGANQTAGNTALSQSNQGAINLTLQNADAETRKQLLNRQGEIETGLIATRAEQDRLTQAQQQEADRAQTELRGQIETGLQELRGGQAEQLAKIDNEYRLLLQSSQSAASFYSQISESMSAILAADLPAAQKQALINHQTTLLNQGLKVIGGIANLDLNEMLSFPTTPTNPTGYKPPAQIPAPIPTNDPNYWRDFLDRLF